MLRHADKIVYTNGKIIIATSFFSGTDDGDFDNNGTIGDSSDNNDTEWKYFLCNFDKEKR